MLLVAFVWIYVVLLMAAAEAASSNGTLLGALFTLLLYGVLPLSIALYLLGTPARRARRRAAEAASAAAGLDPDGRGHTAGDAVPPVREEP
jgi:membrane protein implicated in regulation of membrane protease activity